MNISKLYQRAHFLRMAAKRAGAEEAPAEFYVGAALGECIGDPKGALIADLLRAYRYKPNVLNTLLRSPSPWGWPKSMLAIWTRLLRTYGHKPVLLRAIADGMEA